MFRQRKLLLEMLWRLMEMLEIDRRKWMFRQRKLLLEMLWRLMEMLPGLMEFHRRGRNSAWNCSCSCQRRCSGRGCWGKLRHNHSCCASHSPREPPLCRCLLLWGACVCIRVTIKDTAIRVYSRTATCNSCPQTCTSRTCKNQWKNRYLRSSISKIFNIEVQNFDIRIWISASYRR